MKIIGCLTVCLLVLLLGCTHETTDKQLSDAELYSKYCGNCHIAPAPSSLTQDIWAKNVLPEMGARLGVKDASYNPIRGNSMEENVYIRLANVYPEKPMVDSLSWERLKEYVIRLAPKELPKDSARMNRNSPIQQFEVQQYFGNNETPALAINIQFDSVHQVFNHANVFGDIFENIHDTTKLFKVTTPATAVTRLADTKWAITEVGNLHPSEIPHGKLYILASDEKGDTTFIAKKLHRPVYTQAVDLDSDGELEYLVSEFGNHTGELSLFVQDGSSYKKQTLLALPGCLKTEVHDMNGDGLLDIVALTSQGREGVHILYGLGDLQFEAMTAVEFPPEYGSSWFEMVDYDHDGDLDLITAHGDNADYSYIPKSYHGLRFFENTDAEFGEVYFYPIYGATRFKIEDYDQDGDYDVAVTSFFNDSELSPNEGFVYLENRGSESFDFKGFTFPASVKGRWLVMDHGDVDGDGDIDILIGSLAFQMNPSDKTGGQEKIDPNLHFILLRNIKDF